MNVNDRNVLCILRGFFGNDDSVDDNDGTAVDELISKFGLANTTHSILLTFLLDR